MKALILNSGLGHRMGAITSNHPKCMTQITDKDTILSRQLKLLNKFGIKDVIITTGYYDEVLVDYCKSLELPLQITFVKNPIYDKTNYIYSIYCAKEYLNDDLIFMHGDLVFDEEVFAEIVRAKTSCMAVSSTLELPEKDFKAVVVGDEVKKVGVDLFENAMAAQPLYKLLKKDWEVWLEKICEFCENDNRNCYAENAFNEVSDSCRIKILDVKDRLCGEIDTPEDLANITKRLQENG